MRLIAVQYNGGLNNIAEEMYFNGDKLTSVRTFSLPYGVVGLAMYQGRLLITDGTRLDSLNLEDGSEVQTRAYSGLTNLSGIAIHGNTLESALYSSPYWFTVDLGSGFYYTPSNVSAAKGGNGLARFNNQYIASRASSRYLVYSGEVNAPRAELLNNTPFIYYSLNPKNGQIIGAEMYAEDLYCLNLNLNNMHNFSLAHFATTYRYILIL